MARAIHGFSDGPHLVAFDRDIPPIPALPPMECPVSEFQPYAFQDDRPAPKGLWAWFWRLVRGR